MTDINARLNELEAQNEQLRERVGHLEQQVPTATDSTGRTVTLPDLESFGLTRRQALQALALLAAGSLTLPAAVSRVRGADTTSGVMAANSMETTQIVDGNGNTAISLPGNGSVSVDSIGGAGRPYSNTDDGSDLTQHSAAATTNNETGTIIDVSTSGIWLGGKVIGQKIASITITVDGGTSYSPTTTRFKDGGNEQADYATLPEIEFSSSLKITFSTPSSGTQIVSGQGWRL